MVLNILYVVFAPQGKNDVQEVGIPQSILVFKFYQCLSGSITRCIAVTNAAICAYEMREG